MALGLIAKKVGMSRVFLPSGESVPVTYLEVPENRIIRTKTKEKDGYEAVVLGIGEKIMKTRKGKEHKKYREQKEFQVPSLDGLALGSTVSVATLPAESMVTVTGISKGKGFQGVMKRHNFAGGPRSHGSHFKREPGSVGMRTWPGRIHKGKRMAGHMGLETITLKHRPVIVSDEAKNIVAIKGPIPGPNGSFVSLTPEA
ncbi:MAG: 50S ribosomal protein L3 [Candidatus Peribacteraceae bacterium]